MQSKLRDVATGFGRGEATLETLRGAAIAELVDRPLASRILTLISEWENSSGNHTVRSRDDFRARVKQVVPPAPVIPAASEYRRPPGESIYAAGLRGQQRRR